MANTGTPKMPVNLSERAQLLNGLRTTKPEDSPATNNHRTRAKMGSYDERIHHDFRQMTPEHMVNEKEFHGYHTPSYDPGHMRSYLAMQQKQNELMHQNLFLQQQQARMQQQLMWAGGYPNAYVNNPYTDLAYATMQTPPTPALSNVSAGSPFMPQTPSYVSMRNTPRSSPSVSTDRYNHRKATSLSGSAAVSEIITPSRSSFDISGMRSSLPSSGGLFPPKRMSIRNEGAPSRQPCGPPTVEELVLAPTADVPGSKNFASRLHMRKLPVPELRLTTNSGALAAAMKNRSGGRGRAFSIIVENDASPVEERSTASFGDKQPAIHSDAEGLV